MVRPDDDENRAPRKSKDLPLFTEDYLGQVLDRRYRIVELIGSGGIAQVFRATHVGTGRSLAVKILKPEFSTNIEFIRRFRREAWLTTKLAHDNVVEVLDVQTEDACYLVMELLDGSDLRTYLRRSGPLPWAEVRTIILQICGALQYAHEHGIVHRDLKPANCFRMDPSGRIKVLDFGIARPLSPRDCDGKITVTGALIGTPEYMAPEQYLGEFHARSDMYSAGVIMFELLVGHRPFRSRGAELMHQVMKSPPPSLAEVTADLDCPPQLEAIVARVLARTPDARYASMKEFAQAIAECDASATDECDTSMVTRPFAPKRPRRTLVGMPLRSERSPFVAPRHPPPTSATPPPVESEELPPSPAPEEPRAPDPEPVRVEPVTQLDLASTHEPEESGTTLHEAIRAPAVTEAASVLAAEARRVSTHAPSGPASTLTLVHRRLGLRIGAALAILGVLSGAVVVLPRLISFLVGPSSAASVARPADLRAHADAPKKSHLDPTARPEPDPLVNPAASSAASSPASPPASAAPPEPRPAELPASPPARTAIDTSAPVKPSPEAERRARHRAAKSAIHRVLVKEEVGSSVSRIHVTARFSPEGEVIELNLHDGLPRGAEREQVEASLRKVRLAVGDTEVMVDHVYDLPLPE